MNVQPRSRSRLLRPALATAVAAESLFRGWDAGRNAYREVNEADRDWLIGQLATVGMGVADVAMTGEVTLRGRVLPIGGLKEKLLAALRGGVKKVLIPEENAKDLADIPDNVKSGMEIVPVSRMDEVLKHALVLQPTPIVWEEDLAKPTPAELEEAEHHMHGIDSHDAHDSRELAAGHD